VASSTRALARTSRDLSKVDIPPAQFLRQRIRLRVARLSVCALVGGEEVGVGKLGKDARAVLPV
jgi:hypothetical protein